MDADDQIDQIDALNSLNSLNSNDGDLSQLVLAQTPQATDAETILCDKDKTVSEIIEVEVLIAPLMSNS